MLAMRALLLLSLLAVLCTSFARAEECKENYETVLFPSGMPTGIGWDGKSRPERFKCYAETALSREVRAVVFSEETATGSEDSIYKVKVALVSRPDDAPKVLRSFDITRSIPVFVEGPGNFHKMDAVAETVVGHNNLKILHINVWAVLSGSGALSGSSDLFFLYKPPELSPAALEIRNSSSFSKENMTNLLKKASELFLTGSDGRTTLYVKTVAVEARATGAPTRSLSTSAYVLREERFEPATLGAQVPANAAKLNRVPEISALMVDPGSR